jgi:hypothetical protein
VTITAGEVSSAPAVPFTRDIQLSQRTLASKLLFSTWDIIEIRDKFTSVHEALM